MRAPPARLPAGPVLPLGGEQRWLALSYDACLDALRDHGAFSSSVMGGMGRPGQERGGFGLTMLEAMASGNALVAARAGGATAVVTDGQDGLLVPPGDADALAAALEPLMRDPERAAAMGERARAHVVAHFSVEAEAVQYAAVYRRVLGRAVA